MGKKMVSGLTLLFVEEAQKREAQKRQENSGSIDDGGAMSENSVVEETNTNMESNVVIEEEHVRATDEEDNPKSCFIMPLHYPLFTKEDYEAMPQWQLDQLFTEYGLMISMEGDYDLDYKRKFAMGAFLWPQSNKKPEVFPKSKNAKMV